MHIAYQNYIALMYWVREILKVIRKSGKSNEGHFGLQFCQFVFPCIVQT
uniref:Uncharacterized protein n=1 Tax=Arundo donax TaxID=35708 RepID=A0A0A9AGF0_ARUDO